MNKFLLNFRLTMNLKDTALHDMIKESVDMQRHKSAVTYDNGIESQSFTYQQMWDMASKVFLSYIWNLNCPSLPAGSFIRI